MKQLSDEQYEKFREEFFSYFKVEQLDDGTINAECEVKQQEFVVWLSMVTDFIQNCLNYKKIENYLSVEIQLGKQKVEIALLKRFRTGPHTLRMIAEEENAKLRKENEQLKKQIQSLQFKDTELICKGSIVLGNACLKCTKCLEESKTIVANINKSLR